MKVTIVGRNDLSNAIAQAAIIAGHEPQVCDNVDEIGDCELLIINTKEELEDRQALVKEITYRIDAPVVVTATLTGISAMARYAKDQTRVMGIRFMSTEYVGKYIELTRAFDTNDKTYSLVFEFAKGISELVVEGPDTIGGIFFRLLPVQANMGAFLVSEGVTPEDVDNAMCYGTNAKHPPLVIADELGLDTLLDMLEKIYAETGRPTYRPCPLIKKMVSAGRLGKKSGVGFYKYF